MAKVSTWKEVHKGRIYELSLNFDEIAIVENRFRVSAEVETWSEENPNDKQRVVADVTIQADADGRPILSVNLVGRVAGAENKAQIFHKPLSELIEIDQILDWIPAWAYTGDPITGCMIRSGLSALIGQILDCKKDTVEIPWYLPRMKALARCMLHHVPEMTRNAALRAGKCILRFGF